MKFLMILLFLVVIALYGGINYYIGIRLWGTFFKYIPFINDKVYWSVFCIIAVSYIAAAISRKYSNVVVNFLNTIGSLWMAAMLYFVLIFVVLDIASYILRKFNIIQGVTGSKSFHVVTSLVVLIFIVGIFIYGYRMAVSSKVTNYNIEISKSFADSSDGSINNAGDGGLKVIMVSDLHIGKAVNRVRIEKMVNEINELGPDVVLIAGDIIDDRLEPFIAQNIEPLFKQIKSKYGLYAVLGNHDGYNESVNSVIKEYEKSGINVLQDENILVNDSFYIAGRNDVSLEQGRGKKRKELDEVLKDVDKSKPIIMMDHQPREFDKVEKAGVDVIVSGHTHRGQLAPLNFFTSRMFEIDYGYLKKNDLNIVVSSGYGTWGPLMRVGSQSEIVVINLKGAK